jgi:hypothetical protein
MSAVLVSMAVLIRTFGSGIFVVVSRNLVRNCRWTIVTDRRHSWNGSTQNSFSLPFAAILVNCSPSGDMHNYCTPHIIKENFEYFLIHRCEYILLFQVYCVWQVVKTPTIILNYPIQVKQLFVPLAQNYACKDIVYRYVLRQMTPLMLEDCGWLMQ